MGVGGRRTSAQQRGAGGCKWAGVQSHKPNLASQCYDLAPEGIDPSHLHTAAPAHPYICILFTLFLFHSESREQPHVWGQLVAGWTLLLSQKC